MDARDRFDYNTAISDSWKQQALLNIVTIHYVDMLLFVAVASTASGHTLKGSLCLQWYACLCADYSSICL